MIELTVFNVLLGSAIVSFIVGIGIGVVLADKVRHNRDFRIEMTKDQAIRANRPDILENFETNGYITFTIDDLCVAAGWKSYDAFKYIWYRIPTKDISGRVAGILLGANNWSPRYAYEIAKTYELPINDETLLEIVKYDNVIAAMLIINKITKKGIARALDAAIASDKINMNAYLQCVIE